METLQAAYRVDEGDDVNEPPTTSLLQTDNVSGITDEANLFTSSDAEPVLPEKNPGDTGEEIKTETSGDQQFEEDPNFGSVGAMETENNEKDGPENSGSVTVKEEGEARREEPPLKKQKQLSDLPDSTTSGVAIPEMPQPAEKATLAQPGSGKPPSGKAGKKSKKNKDVWSTTSRKGKKKTKHASKGNHSSQNGSAGHASAEEKLFITPIPRFPDRSVDSPELGICLSKVYKAEKVDLSDDRLTASSSKGYRMVRATPGVSEGAWYFEIIVVHLGETGHTRLGWSTEKGDLQAPVGFDENSYGYRDIDGSKVHKALREKYGDEGYKEGDVIGFYINLPDGESYAPTPRRMVWHKGQRYICAPDAGEDAPKVVPGSEISYFKNGICQGAAFTDLHGGRYYPAASMYTLPNQPACIVKFNFGPDFQNFPEDFGGRPAPKPMIEVPYQSYDDRIENECATKCGINLRYLNSERSEGVHGIFPEYAPWSK